MQTAPTLLEFLINKGVTDISGEPPHPPKPKTRGRKTEGAKTEGAKTGGVTDISGEPHPTPPPNPPTPSAPHSTPPL